MLLGSDVRIDTQYSAVLADEVVAGEFTYQLSSHGLFKGVDRSGGHVLKATGLGWAMETWMNSHPTKFVPRHLRSHHLLDASSATTVVPSRPDGRELWPSAFDHAVALCGFEVVSYIRHPALGTD
jgi:hypothetical protein